MTGGPVELRDIGACVFDAYGTLFDIGAAAAKCHDILGDKTDALTDIWRSKQLTYTWLRSLMGDYVGFNQVTADALDFALETLAIDEAGLRDKLLVLYDELDAYPEVPGVLRDLKAAGRYTAILSNGVPGMLQSAVAHAGIGDDLDAVLSVEAVGIYKPHPSVYQLAVEELGVAPERICFLSSNAWDAAGAAHFGFQVVWVNRFGQKPERLPGKPMAEITNLAELLPLLSA